MNTISGVTRRSFTLFAAFLSCLTLCLLTSLPARAGQDQQGSASEYFPPGVTKSTYLRACRKHNKHLSQTDAALAGEEPKVICRFPASYPAECKKTAKPMESVTLMFDVASTGAVENVRLLEATNECFVQSAANALFFWKYEATENGGVDMVTDVEFKKQASSPSANTDDL